MTRTLRTVRALRRIALACTCALPLTLPLAARAAPVTLQIDPANVVAPVNPQVLNGYNFGNWMPVAEYLEQVQAIPINTLRFPGGNVGDEYDMKPEALDVFKQNLQLMGNPQVLMHTRVFQAKANEAPAKNQPQDAADFVRWTRERGIKAPYWEIGNEPDLFAVTRGDPSWTPERYCDVFRAQAAAIRAVDPQALIAGPAVSGAVPARDRFLEAFVQACGDVVDVVTYHIYPTDGRMGDAAALATASDGDEIIQRYRKLWADPEKNPKGYQRAVKWGVTEYSLSWRSDDPHHLDDMPAAMWAMEVTLRLNKNRLDTVQYFALLTTGGHGLIDTGGIQRPTYYAFGMLGQLKGNFIGARVDDPDLWTHAALDGKTLDVIVINKGKAPKDIVTTLPGYQLQEGEYFDEKITYDQKDNAKLKPAKTLKLGGYTVTRLRYVGR
ncbi:hypothetical protein [Niveibacterium sp. SC-1]|uniref:GH39 family glycosyl hydrolase n=1 Tax=Niveibacterium sp. SC-1 TaxID=3135646 RepID=UPI00311D6E4E